MPDGARTQLGVSGSTGPALDERCRFARTRDGKWREDCDLQLEGAYPPQGKLFVGRGLGRHAGLGGIVQFARYPAAGGWFQLWPVAGERVRLGAQVDGGFDWGGIGVPLAIAASPNVWLFTSPQYYATTRTAGVRIPVGLSVDLNGINRVGFQVQALYEPLPPEGWYPNYRGWRFLGGLELSLFPGQREEDPLAKMAPTGRLAR